MRYESKITQMRPFSCSLVVLGGVIRKSRSWLVTALTVAVMALPVAGRADFHALLRTTSNGQPADEMVSWPSVEAFLAGGEPVNRYGKRPATTGLDMRCVTTDTGGGLLTMLGVTGTDGTYDVHQWQDPFRFSMNLGNYVITRSNAGRVVGLSCGANGRIYAVDERGGESGARTYRVVSWINAKAFLNNRAPVVLGTRSGVSDLAGIEVIDGLLYGVFPVTVNANPGYEVRKWATFEQFLKGPGENMGSREYSETIVEVFSERHVPAASEAGRLARRPVWGWMGNKLPMSAPGVPGLFALEEAFPSLSFQNPIKMLPRPGTGSELWVIGREGYIWSLQNDATTAVKTQVLDISAVTMGWGDSGLLGFAFHPEFGQAGSPNRGFVYAAYNFRPASAVGNATKSFNRVSRFTLADGATVINPASELVMINQFDEHEWHNQGDLFFGDDKFLHVALGDEGGLNDIYKNTQKLNGGLFSGILRLDVDQDPARSHAIRRQPQAGGVVPAGWPATFTQGYGIPNDNPWLDESGGVLEEYWAIGLRNPYRVNRDALTGTVFIGDVGLESEEEINVLAKGANYQWSFKEGQLAGPNPEPQPLIGASTPPLFSYPHKDGNRCVIGGLVYRGSIHAEALGGQYLFGDYGSGRIWAMNWQGLEKPEVRQVANTTGFSLSGFGADQNQEIYLMSLGYYGRIFKLSQREAPPPPATLSATGAFQDLTTLTPARGVLPYDVNAPLWSDNAVKKRWIVVPNNGAPFAPEERIQFQADGPWSYPEGTVLIKHFELPVNDAIPSVLRRIETRFMARAADGLWYGVTYKWRADGSDADLMVEGETGDVEITTTAGGARSQPWTYPSRTDCMQCHNTATSQVLGLRTWQLNGLFQYPDATKKVNQLQKLSSLGLFDLTLTTSRIARMPKASNLADESASLEARVRSYIDSNCAHCHLPGGAQAQMDMRFSTPSAQQNLVNGSLLNQLGIEGASVVKPGVVAQSVLHARLGSLGEIKMPPVAKNLVDEKAVALVARWIKNLERPVVPQALAALAVEPGRVDLTWMDASINEDRFLVRRGKNNKTWTQIGSVGAESTEFSDTTAAYGETYYYQVAAVNENGPSEWTPAVQVKARSSPGLWVGWQEANPLGGQNAPLQNPDGDTAPNLVEFALGGDPASGGSGQERFRLIERTDGGVDAVVTRPRGLQGITMSVMMAQALGSPMVWSIANVTPSVTNHGDGTETLTFARVDKLPGKPAKTRGFARLLVKLQASGETAATEVWGWDRRTQATGTTSFGPSLLGPERFSGRVASGGALLDVAASAGSISVKSRLDADRQAFIEVLDGAYAGHRFDVSSDLSTAATLAIDTASPRNTLGSVPDLSGARLVVRDHWTLGALFPKEKWTAAASQELADQVLFFNSATSDWEACWLADLQGGQRWIWQNDSAQVDQSSLVIPVGTAVLVKRAGAAQAVLSIGLVRSNVFALPVFAGTSLLAGGWPVDQSPADRLMNGGAGFMSSTAPETADQILLWMPDANPSAAPGYQGTFLFSSGAGSYWTNADTAARPNQDQTAIFTANRGFFLRLLTDKPDWRLPLPWTP